MLTFGKEHFDEIGEMFAKGLKAPVRGAAARQDPLSPLNEIHPSQIDSYSSSQLTTVLRQHESAAKIAVVERNQGFSPPVRPYLVPEHQECKTTLCPRCGRAGLGEYQGYLNLDGILKGDIPPTAAVGYGFRPLGGRPVANANVVKNLGLRDPKTGLLPDQKKAGEGVSAAKTERGVKADEDATEAGKGADTEVGTSSATEAVDAASEAVEGSADVTDKAESDKTEVSDIAEPAVSLKTHDSKPSIETAGPKTPSDGFVETNDSNDDLIQFYADSEEETLGNSAQEDEDQQVQIAERPEAETD